MPIPENEIQKILAKRQKFSEDKLSELKKQAESRSQSLEDYVLQEKIINENELYEGYADILKIPMTGLEGSAIRKDILELIPEPIAQSHKLIAFGKSNKKIDVACLDPSDIEIFDFLKKKTGLKISIHLTTPRAFYEAVKQYHKGLKATVEEITGSKDDGLDKDLTKLARDLPTIRIVDTILEYAIFEDASDIHIEPKEKEVLVRYRIDGVLRDVMTLPKNIQSGIIARIKVLSKLKIDEHRLPQDGRFIRETNEYRVSFRVSIIPIYDGEKIVLRLLRETAKALTLEQLGLLSSPLKIIKSNIKKPHGIILVTGPTGSGKTTTLYTIMNILNTPKVNIATIEDPIEYRMPRINQSQVNPRINFTFAIGLRALLRQDPNIIMVGEIRDSETAQISIHAAMTGHLLLSTLHTNNAATAIPRLLEMGIPAFLIASTTNIIIAQRLVRKICVHCVESYTLDKKSLENLTKDVDLADIISVLKREEAVTESNDAQELLFYRGRGCKECNHEGYKGRIGIYEALEVNKKIAELIIARSSAEEIEAQAIKDGMLLMIHDGFIKAKNGITTIEEVLRVTKE